MTKPHVSERCVCVVCLLCLCVSMCVSVSFGVLCVALVHVHVPAGGSNETCEAVIIVQKLILYF